MKVRDAPAADLESLTTDQWGQVTRMVDAAMDLSSEERPRFLEARHATEPVLLAVAIRLLRACERVEKSNFLSESADVYASAIAADFSNRLLAAEASSASALSRALATRYVFESEIGRGGMAIIYKARDLKYERRVAIKVLRPELQEHVTSGRFLREIQIATQLHHPHILPLLESGDADGMLYYVMPLIEGESLRERLKREPQLPIPEALRIASEVADALDCAHQQGIVHRDIKPANILFEKSRSMVADFGIARAIVRAATDPATSTGVSLGTPKYMSPEQAAGAPPIDARSDVYSVGCVVHEMIAGQPPFTGATAQAVLAQSMRAPPVPLRRLRSAVSAEIETLVLRALQKDPADRFSSATELQLALKECLGTAG